MDSNTFNAARLYSSAGPIKKPNGQNPIGTSEKSAQATPDFGQTVRDAAQGVAGAVAGAEAKAGDMMTGKADPHSVIEALAAAELAVETAVTVRDKVVEAYQEILRMPI